MKTIRLEPGAIHQELLPIVRVDKVGWSLDEHGHFVDALLPRLRDENNEAVELDGLNLDIVKLILRPTEELQRRVLKQILAAVDYELEKSTEAAFVSLFDPIRFGDYLSKKINSRTGKPYIKKATRAHKKEALDALFDEAPAAEQSAVSPEEPATENSETEIIPPVPLQQPPVGNATKAANGKR